MKPATPTRAVLAAFSLVVLACGDSTSGTVVSTLQNDNFTPGGSVAFSSGFAAGEAAAVRLGPQPAAFTIRTVRFLFGGATTAHTVTLTIYQDPGTDNPGAPIHTSDHAVTGSDAAFQEIDLTAQNVAVAANTTIRVALFVPHTGVPGIGYDGARTAARNLLYVIPGGWVTSESLMIGGDFVIRAVIATP